MLFLKIVHRGAHYVYGFINALVSVVSPVLAIIMFLAFSAYEVSEYVKKHDTLYLEFREYATGLALGALLLLALS